MIRWLHFYRPHFDDPQSLSDFVESCQALAPPNHSAKIMMHQARRLVELADAMEAVRPGRDALKVFFLIVCAEALAKLADGATDEGRSRAYTRRFFDECTLACDRQLLEQSFVGVDDDGFPRFLSLGDVIDVLYNVRCDVAHEGRYWEFTFCDNGIPMINSNPEIEVRLSYQEFRNVLVRAAINAIRSVLARV